MLVSEIKSLPAGEETKQLRLGLGQVLDYQDSLIPRYRTVRAVLVAEDQPADERWVALCARVGVTLVWPGVLDGLFL